MSSQQGNAPVSGSSPTEDVVDPEGDREGEEAPTDAEIDADADVTPDPAAASDAEITSDVEIAAAGGTILGDAEIAARVDPSRVRRAPRYKRFAVLGGLLGVLIAAIATPFARYDSELALMQGIGPWTLFLVLASVLVPLGILVSCAVAMISDRAARVPERAKKKRKAKEPR